MIKEKVNTSSQILEEAWFAEMINTIKVDQLTYQTDTMEPRRKQMYGNLIDNNYIEAAKDARKISSKIIIPHMLEAYFQCFSKISNVNKLAFELSDTKILVWAEINQNDEDTEDSLLLAEAKINGEFSKAGFRLLTTIVEDCDELEVPENYIKFPINSL